jgi:hypothetical protein
MSRIVIFGDRAGQSVEAASEGPNLWIDAAELERVSGWELKPEGVCKGEVCVPIPAGRGSDFSRDDGKRFNLAELAKLLEQPALRSANQDVWLFGEASVTRRQTITSVEAPDFELPDLDGNLHRLSDYRGKKVLLSAWASW